MAITATFAADFSKWNTEFARVKSELKSFETPVGNVKRQLSSMMDSFSGAKIQKEAQLAAAAVEKIGGVTKLTEAEQKRLNATVTEAIAKYKAMGQAVPADLRKIKAETDAAAKSTTTLGGTLKTAAGVFAGFVSAQLVVRGVGAAFGFAKDAAIGMNASLEKTTLQFGTLMGNSDKAKEHVKGLFDFAARTPFETGPIIEASKQLQVFGGAALNTQKTLTLVGDAAAATGAPIDELARWTGRLYASLQAGRPFGEAAQRLSELAVLSPTVRQRMEDMQKSGKSAAEIFGVFEEQLGSFTGAMVAQAQTWEGQMSTFHDSVNMLLAEALRPLFEEGKTGLQGLNDLLASDAATEWARSTGEAIGEVIGWFVKLQIKVVEAQAAIAELFLLGAKTQRLNPVEAVTGILGSNAEIFGAQLTLTMYLEKLDELKKKLNEGPGAGGKMWGPALDEMREDVVATTNTLTGEEKKIEDVFQKWAKAITGVAAAEEAAQLERRFKRLAESGRLNATAVKGVIEEYDKLRPSLKELPTTLEAIRTLFQDAIPATTGWGDALRYTLIDANAMLETGRKNVERYLSLWDSSDTEFFGPGSALRDVVMKASMQGAPDVLSKTNDIIRLLKTSTRSWDDSLNDLSRSFSELAQISGGTFGGIVQQIGQVISALNLARKASSDIGAGWTQMFSKGGDFSQGLAQFTTGIASGIAAIGQATGSGSKAQRTVGGALAGAQVGSIGGPIGTAVGAGVGALVGWLRGGSAERKALADMKRQFIDAAGGMDVLRKRAEEAGFSIDRFFGEVLSKDVEEAQRQLKELGDTLQLREMRESFLEANGGLYELAKHGARAGADIAAALNAKTPAAFAAAVDKINKAFQEQEKRIAGLKKAAGGLLTEIQGYAQQIEKLLKGKNVVVEAPEAHPGKGGVGVTGGIDTADITKRLQAMAYTANNVFLSMVKETGDVVSALDEVGPALDELISLSGKLGIEITDANTRWLISLRQIQQANPDLMLQIQGLRAQIEGLGAAQRVTQEQFDAFGTSATQIYDDLIARGVPSRDALALMQPTLQALWEAQQKFGLKTDDATQALIDMAKQSGFIDTQMKPGFGALVEVLGDVLDVLKLIAIQLGVVFTNANAAAEAINKMPTPGSAGPNTPGGDPHGGPPAIPGGRPPGYPKNWPWPPVGAPGGPPAGTPLPPPEYARGGFVFGHDGAAMPPWHPKGTDTVPAMLTPGEYVIPKGVVDKLGVPFFQALTGAGRIPLRDGVAHAWMGGWNWPGGIGLPPGGLPLPPNPTPYPAPPPLPKKPPFVIVRPPVPPPVVTPPAPRPEPRYEGGLPGGRDKNRLGGESSFKSTTILELDKREIGRAIADVLPGELRRLGVRVRT